MINYPNEQVDIFFFNFRTTYPIYTKLGIKHFGYRNKQPDSFQRLGMIASKSGKYSEPGFNIRLFVAFCPVREYFTHIQGASLLPVKGCLYWISLPLPINLRPKNEHLIIKVALGVSPGFFFIWTRVLNHN